MLEEHVVLVNENDEVVGSCEKLKAHELGELHRAFSVFVFNNKNELMLQRRALDKYHSAGLWTNTCCSHQRPNETTLDAAHRRLAEEMGFDCELHEKFHFIYRAELENNLIEHELDHVLFGYFDGEPKLNPIEAAEWKWIHLDNLKLEIEQSPESYTAWLKLIVPQLEKHH